MIQILRTYKNLPDPVADFAFDEQLHPLLHLLVQDAGSRCIELHTEIYFKYLLLFDQSA